MTVGIFCAVNGLGNTAPLTEQPPLLFGSLADIESRIAAAKQRLYAAPSWDEKLEHWRAMVRLMDQRPSPSTSLRKEQSSGECRGNAAGGGR